MPRWSPSEIFRGESFDLKGRLADETPGRDARVLLRKETPRTFSRLGLRQREPHGVQTRATAPQERIYIYRIMSVERTQTSTVHLINKIRWPRQLQNM